MGLDRLRAFLRKHSRIALDTNVLIYYLEENPRYLPLTEPVFAWLDRSNSEAVTSTLTMTELLIQPFRRGDQASANLYYGLLSTYPNLHWIAPDLEIAKLAAQYRALHNLKAIDAVHAATASAASATGMITNDAALARVDGLDVLVLDNLLSA